MWWRPHLGGGPEPCLAPPLIRPCLLRSQTTKFNVFQQTSVLNWFSWNHPIQIHCKKASHPLWQEAAHTDSLNKDDYIFIRSWAVFLRWQYQMHPNLLFLHNSFNEFASAASCQSGYNAFLYWAIDIVFSKWTLSGLHRPFSVPNGFQNLWLQ